MALSTSRTRERIVWASVAAARRIDCGGDGRVGHSLRVDPSGDDSHDFECHADRRVVGRNPLEERAGGARPTRTAVALSPDGKTLVFGAIWGGRPQLYARAMDQLSATPISGTSGGISPFFSPDGQWVGFGADGELRKVPLSGGPAVTLCKAAALFGASWGDDGTIVFATQRNGGLSRVSAAGGTPETLTTPQPGDTVTGCPTCCPAAAP